MSEKANRIPDNAAGKYYVDDSCTDCDACRAVAPDNISRNEDNGYSFVSKQPESDVEITQLIEAMSGCPTESIGDDGED